MKKRLVALITALTLSAAVLGGCAGDEGEDTEPSVVTENDDNEKDTAKDSVPTRSMGNKSTELQVNRSSGKMSISRGSFAAFDMSMNIMPAFFLSAAGLLIESGILILSILHGGIDAAIPSLLRIFGSMYGTLFVIGAITTATEWKRIHASPTEKIKAVLTFPVFMFTYLPIAISAIFAKAEWKPIVHSVRAKDMRQRAA